MEPEVKNETSQYCFALGIGTVVATSLSVLKFHENLVIQSTAIVVGAGLIITLNIRMTYMKIYEIMNTTLIEHKINLKLPIIKRQ